MTERPRTQLYHIMKGNKETIENSIITSAISIIMVLIKGIIRHHFDVEKKHKSVTNLVDECEERLQNLEIAQKKEAKQETPLKNETLGWETDADAIERAQELPPRGWVLHGIISEGSVCNIQSPEKGGKSALAKQIAHDYAYDTNSMDLPDVEISASHHNEAFIYDAELCDNDIEERYKNLNDTKVHRKPMSFFTNADQLISHMRTSISNINSNVLVVVDNVSMICPNFSKNDIEQIRQEIRTLQKKFNRRGFYLTIIFIHHTKASASGSSTDDRAGSVQWGRASDLSLSLLHCNLGSEYRVLKELNNRGKDGLLAQGEVAVLRLVGNPYLHFQFVRIAEESEVLCKNKKTSELKSNNDTSNNEWKLNDDEENYVCTNYIPREVGLGKLAKYLLKNHNIEVTKPNVNQMKSVVKRTLVGKDLYQG